MFLKIYTTIQKFEISKIFYVFDIILTKAAFIWSSITNSNIVKYYYNFI